MGGSGYGWDRKRVGSYENGTVYRGYGWDRIRIGLLEGPEQDAAAAALLLLLSEET